MVGADNISDVDSEFTSSQAPVSSLSLTSTPLNDVRLSDVSEFTFSQASASSFISLPPASLSDVGLSDVSLNDARLSGVSLDDAGFSDVDLGNDVNTALLALPDTTATLLLDGSASAGSTSAAAAAAGATQQAEIKKPTERTAFDCLLGEPESSDAVPPPRPRSERKGGRHAEDAASDAAARIASDEDTRPKTIYISLIGVEEFKWSGLPNNNIG